MGVEAREGGKGAEQHKEEGRTGRKRLRPRRRRITRGVCEQEDEEE